MPRPAPDTAHGSGDRLQEAGPPHPRAAWLTPQHSRRGHHAHAQAASGTEPGHPRQTQPGNSPRRPAARPARNHLLSRRDTGRPAMPRSHQPLLIPRTGVSDGPQPPQSQQLLQLTELLRTPSPFHSGCVLGQELRMVTLRQHGEDRDRIIRIMITNRMRGHCPLHSAPQQTAAHGSPHAIIVRTTSPACPGPPPDPPATHRSQRKEPDRSRPQCRTALGGRGLETSDCRFNTPMRECSPRLRSHLMIPSAPPPAPTLACAAH